MANCSCDSDTSIPSDVTNWLATPAPFNAEKHGARARFSGDDSSVVERREPDDHCDGGVAYTASPLPLGHVWQITLLNTTGRQWGFGLVRCMYTVERLKSGHLKYGHLDKQGTFGCPKHPVCVHYNPLNQDTSLIRTLSAVPD